MNNGVGFLGLLALIFIGLKLAAVGVVASWSWWAVLAPLWGPVVLAVIAAILVHAQNHRDARKYWERK